MSRKASFRTASMSSQRDQQRPLLDVNEPNTASPTVVYHEHGSGSGSGSGSGDAGGGGGDDMAHFNWEKVSIDEALEMLKTSRDGLDEREAELRLNEHGPNKLPETHVSPLLVFLSFMWNPLSWAMEVAAVIAIVLLDYLDFALIIALLLLNASIGFYEEQSAGNAVAALMGQLAPQAKVRRNKQWRNVPSADLVPGDVIRIRLGDVVPADVKLLEGDEVKIDQSSLTGESLPVTKRAGSEAYSGSIVKMGEIEAAVHSTGINTFFGKAANLIDGTESTGRLQQVLTTVGNFCIVSIVAWVVVELIVQFVHQNTPCAFGPHKCPTLSNLLVLIVGGIPVAMPTVLSVTMALGAMTLARKDAIVTRLTAIEELASMDILCSDKTGTLTLNKLSIDPITIFTVNGYQQKDVLIDGALAARIENNEPIDLCVHDNCPEKDSIWEDYELLHYVPFDPVNKRTIAKLKHKRTGKIIRTCKGAPWVVYEMDVNRDEIAGTVKAKINEFASRGYRALGVARAEDGDVELDQLKWKMVGLIPLFDPPRVDSGDTIREANRLGIDVKMITGDQLAIGVETCRQLGIPSDISTTEFFSYNSGKSSDQIDELVEQCDGFAEVFPEHKYEIVKRLQQRDHVVGMTGDGVNDAPALKKADIGIAVDDATDAARAASDIVLRSPGLSVIIDAIIASRMIFQRMKNYAIYSIAMTVRIVFTFGLLTTLYNWYFPAIIIVILAVLNDGTVMTIAKDNVKPSPQPDSWNLREVFSTAIVLGLWLTVSTVVIFHIAYRTTAMTELHLEDYSVVSLMDAANAAHPKFGLDWWDANKCVWPQTFHKSDDFTKMLNTTCAALTEPTAAAECYCDVLADRQAKLRGFVYITVSVTGQATIFITRTRRFFWEDKPANIVMFAFFFAQLVATIIGKVGFNGYPSSRAAFEGCSWGYVALAWVWSAIWFAPMDLIKMFVRYCLTHDLSMTYNRTAFTTTINAGHPSGRYSRAATAPHRALRYGSVGGASFRRSSKLRTFSGM